MQFAFFKFVINIMNDDVLKFNSVKIRILCYTLFVDDRESNSFLIKKIKECFREIHNEKSKN